MSRRLLAAVAVTALTLGLASCGDGGENVVTTPPPTIDIGQSDDGGAEPIDDGGAEQSDDGGAEQSDSEGAGEGEDSPAAAPDIPAPDPADYPGMDQETPEGAEQAFKFFWDTSIAGFQGGDASQLETLSSEGCKNCDALIGQIEDLEEHGEFWSKFETTDVELVAEEGGQDYTHIVTYSFIIPAHTEPASDPVDWGEITYTARGGLIWDSGTWLVVDFNADFVESAAI